MYLKRLELNGFKSFAKKTVLKFQTPITAVVGPNGSGKSNVAEALQWVLGEQSLKSLRGKKGEDFIFSGSQTSSRLSRASVILVFDNRGKKFGDIDFQEVIIERRVYRDGANEYLLNGSQVRLKDIIEILAKVGLGASRHHIISQGESDRILYASPQERKEMIEDALGIRIFQLKRKEAERKLEQTEENMKQASSLRREIQPHLKFLTVQAEKIKKAEEIRQELEKKMRDYLERENSYLLAQAKKLDFEKEIPRKNLLEKEKEIKILREKIKTEERRGENGRPEENSELLKIKSDIEKSREKISQLEREMGRLEGMIELKKEKETEKESPAVPSEEIKLFLEKLKDKLTETLAADNPEKIKEFIKETLRIIDSFSGKFSSFKKDFSDLKELEEKMAKIEKNLSHSKKEEEKHQKLFNQTSSEIQDSFKNLREMEREIYRLESESSRIKDDLRGFELAEEKLRLRKDEFEKEKKEAEILFGKFSFNESLESKNDFDDTLREKLKKEIERMKIRTEEAGGMDSSVLKEFEETKKRDEFLTKELKDLEDSGQNLKKIIKDLEIKLEEDFQTGVEKINKEFQKHFETMFGGGRAGLKLIKPQRLKKENDLEIALETESQNEDTETGVEISINLPRKRIKSLEMLSGGERALSSIALLFALSAVNPPPFL
ncbi:MAG: AAA family ATPase, partial [Patescibacteria group bacterium]